MPANLSRSHRTGGTGAAAPAHADRPPSAPALAVGDLLAGKYRVERILGEGGMGVVVAAHHELLDQRVAVKLLYHDVADRDAQTRLLAEARAAAKLQSEHVARVVDVDTGPNGLPFIVMELLEGADLCQIADARGALPRWLVVDYMLQALEGLAHAHAHGIVHRDLKPSNLFLTNKPDGTQIIKILDFGIAKLASEDAEKQKLTGGGRGVLGSPPYMSPEQVRAPKTIDARTDVWSIGICMYELLTNSMPFGGDELQETFAQILERTPSPIRDLVTGVPAGLEEIVMRCLAKKREDRFQDVGELARALVPYGSGTWIQSAERITATLARAPDEASGTRLRASAGGQRVELPGAPRSSGSVMPPLTANTFSRGPSEAPNDASRSRRLVIAAVAVFSLVGVALIAGTTIAHRRAAAAVDVPAATTAPAVPSATGQTAPTTEVPAPVPGPATTLVTAPVTTAGPENEVTAPPTPIATAAPASPPTSRAPKTNAKPPPAKRGPATPGKPAPLPPGLPRERQ